jgi:STE24 endopeptidase
LNESKATRYQRLRRRTQVISLAAGFGLLLLIALTRTSDWLAGFAARLALGWPDAWRPVIATTVFVGALAFAAEIIAFPVSVFAASRASRRKRLEVNAGALMGAQARDALAGAAIALAVAGLVRLAMWAGGPWWWALASVMLACSTLVALGLLSLGLSLSGETRPLSRTSLIAPLAALAERACGRPVTVREWTSSPPGATAVITGVGRVGKVLLSTEMVRDWAEDEIAVVVAHELSHQAHHDLARKVAMDAALWCVSLGVADRVVSMWGPALQVRSVTDLAALPLLALAAGAIWCLLRPLRLAQSRAQERRADRFALELTGNSEAFARALRRVGEAHLAEDRPSRLTRWFFHRHPTLEERLAASARLEGQR